MSHKKWLGTLTLISAAVAAMAVAQSSAEVWELVKTELVRVIGPKPLTPHVLEQVQPTEEGDYLEIAKVMFTNQMRQYLKGQDTNPKDNKAVRDAHAKAHACVVGEFKVNKYVPRWARSGFLSEPGHTFPAIVRYSNGSGLIGQPDINPDGRGMAIKLIDPSILKTNLLGTGKTQDFLMVNNERFLNKDVRDYLTMQRISLQTGAPTGYFVIRAIKEALGEETSEEKVQSLIPEIQALATGSKEASEKLRALLGPDDSLKLLAKLGAMKEGKAPLDLVIGREMQKQVGSGLTESYFSMTSFLLKSPDSADENRDTAVKYQVRPIDCRSGRPLQATKVPAHAEPNFLREDLLSRISSKDHCFAFSIQPLPEKADHAEKVKLVEDARLNYQTRAIQVATIRIKQQDVSSLDKSVYCENLSFNPWQAQPENRPLGGLNRSRRFAVTASSIRRHLLNGVERQEPVSVREYQQR